MSEKTYAERPTPKSASTSAGTYHPLAITALVFSILAFNVLPLVGSIAGIIIGKHAREEIDESPAEYKGRGFATAAIRLGWFAIMLWVLAVVTAVTLVIVLIARN